jgi:hypothetical protein
MITPRHHLLTTVILILSLAACSTQDLDGDGFFRQPEPGDAISMIGSIAAPVGDLRIKVNGKFLVTESADRKFNYWELRGGLLSSVSVPAGAPIDLVNGGGQTLLHIGPVVPSAITHTLVWVHGSATDLVAEIPDLVPDDDETTAEVRVVNVSMAERVIVSRCVGVVSCTNCGTTAPTNTAFGDFALSDCEALTTVGPGQEWTSKLEPTNITAGGGSACLAVQDEGSVLGPICRVELNRPSPVFQERSHIFIDGLFNTTAYLPDGTAVPFPSGFVAGNKF